MWNRMLEWILFHRQSNFVMTSAEKVTLCQMMRLQRQVCPLKSPKLLFQSNVLACCYRIIVRLGLYNSETSRVRIDVIHTQTYLHTHTFATKTVRVIQYAGKLARHFNQMCLALSLCTPCVYKNNFAPSNSI